MKTRVESRLVSFPEPRNLSRILDPLERLERRHDRVVLDRQARFRSEGTWYEIPRVVLMDPQEDRDPIKIGIFAGIHGDEPAGVLALVKWLEDLARQPEKQMGYQIIAYPICNPTGYEDGTRFSRRGVDLNREFWKNSDHPEISWIEEALVSDRFDGIITLHSDDTSEGLYGFAIGSTLTESILSPALQAASQALPVNLHPEIDGFSAQGGLIRDCYPGILSAPPTISPKPFEITFETPSLARMEDQVKATCLALDSILKEYRPFVAIGANL